MVKAKIEVERDLDMDVAASLRELAATSDELTGKILKKSQEAAKKGASHIDFKISEEDYDFLQNRDTPGPARFDSTPPFIERLESLGFKLDSTCEQTSWSKFKQSIDYEFTKSYNYYIIVRW